MSDLEKIIDACLSGNNEAMLKGEAAIEKFKSNSQFLLGLAQILLNPKVDEHKRQWTGIVLKKCIKDSWNSKEIDEKDRELLRNNIPKGLTDRSTKILSSVSLVIAQIAEFDFPEKWPNLLGGLLHLLGSGDPATIFGSVTCLALLSEHFSTAQLPIAFPKIIPLMNEMIPKCPPEISVKSLVVIHGCYSLYSEQPSEERKSMKKDFQASLLPTLVNILGIIEKPSTNSRALKFEALRVLFLCVEAFGSSIKKYSKEICKSIFSSMFMEAELYSKYKGQDDVKSPTFVNVLVEQLELIDAIVENEIFSDLIQPNCEKIIGLAIRYMIFSADEMQLWQEEPNLFISQNDDDGIFFTVRSCARDVITSLCHKFENVTHFVIKNMIEHFKVTPSNENKNWWILREASLYALGSCSKHINQKQLNMEGLFKTILQNDLDVNSPDYLKSTALWFLSKCISFQNLDILKYYLEATLVYLKPSYAIPIKLNACISLCRVLKHIPREVFGKYSRPVMERLCSLLGFTTEDTTHYVVEGMNVLLIEYPDSCIKDIFPLLLQILNKYSNDPLIVEETEDVFDTVAHIPSLKLEMYQNVLPLLISTMKNEKTTFQLNEICVHLLGIIADSADSETIGKIIEVSLPAMMNLMVKTDEINMLQNGLETFKAMVHRGAKHLNLGVLSEFIKKILNSEDSACLGLSNLLSEMLKQFGKDMNQILPNILRAMLNRLADSEHATLNQQFIVFFSKLICFDFSIVEFISKHLIGTDTALQILCKKWIHYQPLIFSEYNLKVTISGLTRMIMSGDKRFAFPIKTEKLETQDTSKRLTRGNSKKVTVEIPFAAEAFIVMIKAYSYILNELKNDELYQFEDEDGEVGFGDEEEDENFDDDDDNEEPGHFSLKKGDEDADEWEDDFQDEYTKDDEYSTLNIQNFVQDSVKQIFLKHGNLVDYASKFLEPKEFEILKTLLK